MTKSTFRIQELSLMEIEWLLYHSHPDTIRYRLLQTAKTHRLESPNKAYQYSRYGFSKQQAHQVKQRYVQLQEDWDGLYALSLIKTSISKLMINELDDATPILNLIERDAELCKLRNRFCLPNAEAVRFLIKTLKEHFFFARNYTDLNRVIALDDFYAPFFEINDEIQSYIRKVNYSIRFLDWQKLEDIQGITLNYLKKYNEQLSIKLKLSLIRFMIARYFYSKNYTAIEVLLQQILDEYSLNPYYYKEEYIALNFVTFFNNYTHIGLYHKALVHFQYPQLDTNSRAFKANIYAYLGIALDSYDMQTATQYIQLLQKRPIETIRPIILHLIARYFLLKQNIPKMLPYLQQALQYLKRSKSDELHGEIYSIQFRYLSLKQDYPEIIKLHNSPKIRQYRKTYAALSAHNFELQLYFLVAKYCHKAMLEETFNEKLHQLLLQTIQNTNGFLKLKAIENMHQLLGQKLLRIESRNKNLYTQLTQEMNGYTTLFHLDTSLSW